MALIAQVEPGKGAVERLELHLQTGHPGPRRPTADPLDEGVHRGVITGSHDLHLAARDVPHIANQPQLPGPALGGPAEAYPLDTPGDKEAELFHGAPLKTWIVPRQKGAAQRLPHS